MKLIEFGQLFLMITVGFGGFMVSAVVFEFLATIIPVGLAMLVFFLLIALVVALFMVIYDWEPLPQYPAWETFGDRGTFNPKRFLGPIDGGDDGRKSLPEVAMEPKRFWPGDGRREKR